MSFEKIGQTLSSPIASGRALAIGEDNAYAPLHQAEKIIPCLSSSTEKNNPLPPMITLAKKFQPYIKEKNNYFLPLCNNFEIIVGHPNSNCPNFEKTIIGLYNRLKSLSYFVNSAITWAFVLLETTDFAWKFV